MSFNKMFNRSIGHSVKLNGLLKIPLNSLLKFDEIDHQDIINAVNTVEKSPVFSYDTDFKA